MTTLDQEVRKYQARLCHVQLSEEQLAHVMAIGSVVEGTPVALWGYGLQYIFNNGMERGARRLLDTKYKGCTPEDAKREFVRLAKIWCEPLASVFRD